MKQRVFIKLKDEQLVGELYLPLGPGPHPAIVVAGPMTSVKEQVSGVYAVALAMRGFAALALDHRHYGESSGQPRQLEHHEHKVEDLSAALDWLAQQASVDPERLGLAGVCLGAGYACYASGANPRAKALGLVSGYYRDPQQLRQRDLQGFERLIEQGRAARERYEQTGHNTLIPAAALDQDAAMSTASTVDYYATPRAGVPNYQNAFAVMSRERFLPFDVQAIAPRLTVPTAMIHARGAIAVPWAEAFYDALAAPKALTWLEAASQVDFYDQPGLVSAAADILAAHFVHHLNPKEAHGQDRHQEQAHRGGLGAPA